MFRRDKFECHGRTVVTEETAPEGTQRFAGKLACAGIRGDNGEIAEFLTVHTEQKEKGYYHNAQKGRIRGIANKSLEVRCQTCPLNPDSQDADALQEFLDERADDRREDLDIDTSDLFDKWNE